MNITTPESQLKRSLVYRQQAQATFIEVAGGAIAWDCRNDPAQACKAGLLDLSALPRMALRGPNAPSFLEAAGLPVPSQPNRASRTDNGEQVLRLGQKEFWILGSLADQGAGTEALKQVAWPEQGCHELYCQDSHAWFALTGQHLPDIMAKLCGVDLRPAAAPAGSVVQTSVARVNAIILCHRLHDVPCFSILCDSASAPYLWDCLLDAMQEFAGQAIGLASLQAG